MNNRTHRSRKLVKGALAALLAATTFAACSGGEDASTGTYKTLRERQAEIPRPLTLEEQGCFHGQPDPRVDYWLIYCPGD